MIQYFNFDQLTRPLPSYANYIKKISGFWIFSPEQEKPPTFVNAEPVGGSQTKSGNGAHSNAFVDLNEDGNADIFTSNKNRFGREILSHLLTRGH